MKRAQSRPAGRACRCPDTRCAALAAASAGHTVVERRSADVIVIGGSALAGAAAFSLARRGRRVVHLHQAGLQAALPPPEALKPLLLLDSDPQLTSVHNDAVAFYRGLEQQAGVPLVWRTRALDIACMAPRPDEAAPAGAPLEQLMQRMSDAGRAARVRFSAVKPGDLLTPYPMLRMPPGAAGLLQVDAGVINARAVSGALSSLGERAGVAVRSTLLLRGWQDAGAFIRVRASSALQPDLVSVFEAESVLLAPGTWPADSLRLWGLEVPGLKLQERLSARCAAGESLARTPLLRVWSDGGGEDGAGGRGGGGGVERDRGPWAWQLYPRVHPGAGSACKLSGAPPTTSRHVSSAWELVPELVPGLEKARRLLREDAADPKPQGDGVAQAGAALLSMWRQAAGIAKGLGPPAAKRARQGQTWEEDEEEDGEDANSEIRQVPAPERVAVTSAWDPVTTDGRPVLGWHPCFEEGRVLVACAAGSVLSSASASAQAPILGKAAADLLLGSALVASELSVELDSLAVSRQALGGRAPQGWNAQEAWESLHELQDGQAYAQSMIANLTDDERQALEEVTARLARA